ncbi:response regulator transcription factor [Sulfuriflexus mobilis]|uniref:response regulator transcription factor n=1 Tax=Sulfuriflexus mobilis TaxID=1811807 RepID=UPI000F844F60|nr:response regulator transcription factor [Sulfuriflexus mobilis]
MRLLLVEDDPILGPRLRQDLRRAGFAVDLVDNGIDGQFQGEEEPYDVAILDLGLPGRPGLEVLQNWRKAGMQLPVIILTSRDAWHERVDGLKAGADDYVGKPFHREELLARLDALLRRLQERNGPQLTVAGLTLDEEHQRVILADGEAVELTGTEFRLLRYMMINPGKLLGKSRLTEHVYEGDADRDSNVIEAYIKRLRQKIGKSLIVTRRGQGYIFGSSAQ